MYLKITSQNIEKSCAFLCEQAANGTIRGKWKKFQNLKLFFEQNIFFCSAQGKNRNYAYIKKIEYEYQKGLLKNFRGFKEKLFVDLGKCM